MATLRDRRPPQDRERMLALYRRRSELLKRRFALVGDDSAAARAERAAIRAEDEELSVPIAWAVRRRLGRPHLFPGIPPEPGR